MDCLFVVDTGGDTGKGKKTNLIYSVEGDALDEVEESPQVEVIDDKESEEDIVEFDEAEEEYIITSKSLFQTILWLELSIIARN